MRKLYHMCKYLGRPKWVAPNFSKNHSMRRILHPYCKQREKEREREEEGQRRGGKEGGRWREGGRGVEKIGGKRGSLAQTA